jgi:hypothetical protein
LNISDWIIGKLEEKFQFKMEKDSRNQRSGVTKGLPDLNPNAGIKMELRTITYNIKF